MNCEEAAEFVSALYDGETISQDVAQHVAECRVCQFRFKQYAEIGVGLRLAASLETQQATPLVLEQPKRSFTIWWQKGWEMMRIPRFAFALLVVGILLLSSGLAIVGVRAKSHGTVVMLSVSPVQGQPHPCPLSTEDKKRQVCGLAGLLESGELSYSIQLLSVDGDKLELGVRAKYAALPPGAHHSLISWTSVQELPQTRYWFQPGENLKVDVAGLGQMEVTGEWLDHMPSVLTENHDIDPGAGEMRIVSPILLRGKEVVGDMEGGIVSVEKAGQAVDIYWPGEGRFDISLSPLEGAVEGRVKLNRIFFEIDGRSYTLMTGTPITRSQQVWILHDPDFKPSQEGGDNAYIGMRAFPAAVSGTMQK